VLLAFLLFLWNMLLLYGGPAVTGFPILAGG
jgi:hypothetical protein